MACSSNSIPSEADARAAFETKLKQKPDADSIEIVSFTKTNGKLVEGLGVKVYVVDYEAVLKYGKGLNADCLTLPKENLSRNLLI